jgi:hypothetical protein
MAWTTMILSLLGEKTCSFLRHGCNRGFQPITRHTNIIWSMHFEWILDGFCWMKQTQNGNAKSMVVLDYKLKHTNKELGK